MADYDVFNGDADGICALHQLRLAEPRAAELVTGVKRDVRLLDRLVGRTSGGDQITVLDISIEPNAGALQSLLAGGARVRWFDHHNPGDLPAHPNLDATIDCAPDVCTSVLVDRYLSGRYRPWAVVALFGDGLPAPATRLAESIGMDPESTRQLQSLGNAINYNAYGYVAADLRVAPADLYRRIARYDDPLDFVRSDAVVGELAGLMSADLDCAAKLDPVVDTANCLAYRFPDEFWARRVSGHFANVIAERCPDRAIAVLTVLPAGGLQVSVRAPRSGPTGADLLCRRFPTGGGRAAAGGINTLPFAREAEFLREFAAHFAGESTTQRDR